MDLIYLFILILFTVVMLAMYFDKKLVRFLDSLETPRLYSTEKHRDESTLEHPEY